MSNTSASEGLFNIFQPGLLRGSEKLAFAPHKKYFYVEHPVEGWRVYLRACCFLHEADQAFDIKRFLVVKRKDATATSKSWEPPKGQMEGKDANPIEASLIELMAENVKREVHEEAKIDKFTHMRYTGLVVQSQEPDYPENNYFQYHLFQALVEPSTIEKAQAEFEWLNAHPKAWKRMKSDVREKDALTWFNPSKTRLMGKWSPSIVALYLERGSSI